MYGAGHSPLRPQQPPAYDDVTPLVEPFSYLLQVPGKEVRSMLVDSFNKWLKVKDEPLTRIKKITRMLHTSSLLIDDIEDNSRLRRGIPVAHMVYGVASTINAANFVYFDALRETKELNSVDCHIIFADELIRLHWGQGYEIYWRDHLVCPSEEDYRRMVVDKTGGLFRLAIRMMQVFSDDKRDYIPLANNLALYFQIRDDYMNLHASTSLNKSFCEDLTEGKYSFPILHCISSNPSDHRLINILKQRTEDVEMKKYAVEYMKQTGSFEYTKKVLKTIQVETEKQIADLGGNPELSQLLVVLASTMDPSAETQPQRRLIPLKLSREDPGGS